MSMMMDLRTEQRQVLSQKLIQSANILQMASAELTEYLTEQALENPVMELVPSADALHQRDKNSEEIEKYRWICANDEQDHRSFHAADTEDDDNGEWKFRSEKRETLRGELMSQLTPRTADGEFGRRVRAMMDCLDSRGYFACTIEEAAKAIGITEDEALEALRAIQGLEPAGVGARDLQECLILQLERRGILTEKLRRFVNEHLYDMAKNRLPYIARAMNLPVSEVASYRDIVRTLDPRPAARYEGENAAYIIPDVIVDRNADGFQITLNDNLCPDIRLNAEYLRMAETISDDEVKKYLADKIRRTRWIKECVAKRGSTLMRIARAIVARQTQFFTDSNAPMAPLRMSDIAADTSVHESTVSRAVHGKYLQCVRGTYQLSEFFKKAVPTGGKADSNEAIRTAEETKRALKELIDAEDKKKPRSDSVLAALLAERGCVISRRTAAKYREEMHIPGSAGRRRY